MIKNVEIKNFKSIKHVKLNCGRINVFIGQPNTGKSNLLEAIVGLPSYGYYHTIRNLEDFIRMKEQNDLFYDQNLDDSVYINFDGDEKPVGFEIRFYDDKYLLIPFYNNEEQSETYLSKPEIINPNTTGFLKSC
jgi:AAA15 family ATPase/GTPase